MDDTAPPERWTERQAVVVVFVAIASLLIGGIVGYGMATPSTAHAAEQLTGVSAKVVNLAKVEALARVPAGVKADVAVTDLGGGAFQVTTVNAGLKQAVPSRADKILGGDLSSLSPTQRAIALHVTGPWYHPHNEIGHCFGYWHGDANAFYGSNHIGMVRTFFSGPAYQNKKCSTSVQTSHMWGVSYGPDTVKSELRTTASAIYPNTLIAGPHAAHRWYSGPTWSIPNVTGCIRGVGHFRQPPSGGSVFYASIEFC